jgi:ribose 1,5-bisphosphate isomerase
METGAPLPRHWMLRALDLETDRDHGADHLSREGVLAFREAVTEAWETGGDPAAIRRKLEAYAQRLRRAQPSMAPLAGRLGRCVAALEGGREATLAEADAVLAEADAAGRALVQIADSLFRPGLRLLTHSFSQTVLDLLTHYGDRLERVTVCEARPLNEGLRLAAAVADLALPVRLITEAQLELFVPECDLALAGADRVLPNGDVVNKAGTAVVARLCAAHRVPLYVAADRSKWVVEGDELARFARERRPPSEVTTETPRGVEITNIGFDLTPAELVAGYITDQSLVEGGQAAAATHARQGLFTAGATSRSVQGPTSSGSAPA